MWWWLPCVAVRQLNSTLVTACDHPFILYLQSSCILSVWKLKTEMLFFGCQYKNGKIKAAHLFKWVHEQTAISINWYHAIAWCKTNAKITNKAMLEVYLDRVGQCSALWLVSGSQLGQPQRHSTVDGFRRFLEEMRNINRQQRLNVR